jgi:L-ascorbate metabolism protein UlaG (beta-lactamase superfamily)
MFAILGAQLPDSQGASMHPLAELTVPAGAVAIHWFEQSCYAIKDEYGTIVQIDPYFPHDRPADRFLYPDPPLDEATLPTDFVLLTHDHRDHTWPESLERIRQAFPQVKLIGPEESIQNILKNTGAELTATTTIQAGMGVDLRSMTVYAVYAKPPQGDPQAGIKPPDVTHLGYVLKAGKHTLYFSGDPIHTFAEHDDLVNAVAAFKPDLGFLTTHPSEGEFPFFDGSVKMAQRIGLKHAFPSHRECFVKRNYDPHTWAALLPATGPKPVVIARNSHFLYDGTQ